MRRLFVLALVATCTVVACGKPSPEPQQAKAEPASAAAPGPAGATTTTNAAMTHAEIGKAAPDFTLKDLDGKDVRLSSFKGKAVVLEWFNPGCPVVGRAHTKGSLVDAAKKAQKAGVVWLAINSGAAGKQGHGVEANREGVKSFGLENPVLLDEAGDVGRAYGATNTPHMMVIDDKGVLVYRGAVDNSPDGEGESPTGGKLVRYVDAALAEIAAGKPVSTPETKAYGCSVKYAAK